MNGEHTTIVPQLIGNELSYNNDKYIFVYHYTNIFKNEKKTLLIKKTNANTFYTINLCKSV